MLYSYAQLINPTDKEISLVKFTKWLKDEDRLMRAFTISEYTTLLEGLESNIKYLCMQNRTKGKSVWKEAREVLLHEEDIIKSA